MSYKASICNSRAVSLPREHIISGSKSEESIFLEILSKKFVNISKYGRKKKEKKKVKIFSEKIKRRILDVMELFRLDRRHKIFFIQEAPRSFLFCLIFFV